MKKKILVVGILTLISLLIAGCGNKVTGNAVVDSKDYVNIPLSEVTDTVKFYTFNDGGVNIKYFAVLGSDGKPRIAFDACDVCGGYKGYRQTGNDITCNNCGKVFSIDGLGTKNKGYGCWPSYLPNEEKGKDILIKISDLEEGRQRFA